MIKKIEIGMGIVFIALCIAICISLKLKNDNRIYPSDVVYEFFTEMTSGNFKVAMESYLDSYNDNQIDVLYGNIDLYKTHWANLGIEIESEALNDSEGTAACQVKVNKYDITEIIGDVRLRLLDVNEIKEDGTLITEEELNVLKKQYIKDAYNNAKGRYKVIKNTYDLNLIYDDEYETYKIVNDKNISDILFGNTSDEEKNKARDAVKKEEEQNIKEEKENNELINNDIVG